MKKFETPELEVVKFNVADVITTSKQDPGSILPDDEV
jgi:hypothetical protein